MLASANKGLAMQISQAREQYVRWLIATRDFSPHTIRAYDGDLATFERHVGANASVERIDSGCILAFIEQQQLAGLASTSVRRRAASLRGYCRWLLAEGHLESDPSRGTIVAVSRSRRLPRAVPQHELDCLLRHLRRAACVSLTVGAEAILKRPHDATTLLAVALMVATGIRVHEAAGISVADIDLPARRLRILGKGRRERHVFLGNDWIAGLAAAYLRTRAALELTHQRLLFNRSGAPLTPPAIRARLAKAARDAGIRARLTPHMLRHSAATQLIEAGVDIRYIQRLLGHASLTTTEIYTHVSDAALSRVISDADVLGRLLRR